MALGVFAQEHPKDVLKPGTVFRFERVDTVVDGQAVPREPREFTHTITSVGVAVLAEQDSQSKTAGMEIMRDIRFPLAVGKTWDVETSYKSGNSDYVRRSDYRVTALENQLVLGHSMPVYRIEATGWVNRRIAGQSNGGAAWQFGRVAWYAPSIGYIVQVHFWEKSPRGLLMKDFSYQLKRVEIANMAQAGR